MIFKGSDFAVILVYLTWKWVVWNFKDLLDYTTIVSALSNSSFIQYCDSNIGLFSFASYKVITLPILLLALKGDSEEER